MKIICLVFLQEYRKRILQKIVRDYLDNQAKEGLQEEAE
jgi:hypothetical protein